MLIGAIADDLTGATDLALMLSNAGMSALVSIGVPADDAQFLDAQAVVVALKSRTIPAADAVAQSVQSARVLASQGARQFYFKYCSTFDSTDEGNIGPVTDALLSFLGEDRTIACPAFPTNGRTVYKGHLFVGDALLSESSMRDHPLTPMRDANLVRVLRRQTQRPVWLADHATVTGNCLAAALAARPGIFVVDAVSDADLRTIGAAASLLKLVTGGSGLAMGLPANFGISTQSRAVVPALEPGRAVVIAGSCSATTRRQIDIAERSGIPSLRLDALAIAAGEASIEAVAAFFDRNRPAPVSIVYSSAAPEMVAAAQAEIGSRDLGIAVERFLGEVAVKLADRGATRFLIAGGETSGAVVTALGLGQLAIGPQIDPGVPWTFASRDGKNLALALKSGNFGGDDLFLRAWESLH